MIAIMTGRTMLTRARAKFSVSPLVEKRTLDVGATSLAIAEPDFIDAADLTKRDRIFRPARRRRIVAATMKVL
jgi:hypothetical protein